MFRSAFYQLLRIDSLRFAYCKLRWIINRRKLRFAPHISDDVGADTIKHNLSAFDHTAVFGMAKRMSLLLYPVAALMRGRSEPRVLIVGPRSEDDIFWAKSLGLTDVVGLDLFSYSKYVKVGDVHATGFETGSFDAVLLGWVISYSKTPQRIMLECMRILKPGGFLAVGIEVDPDQSQLGLRPPRMNPVNSADDIQALIQMERVFHTEPAPNERGECGIVLRKSAKAA